MEDHSLLVDDGHHFFIKTEVVDNAEENYDPDAISVFPEEYNSIDVKLESEIKQENHEEIVFGDNCKLEKDKFEEELDKIIIKEEKNSIDRFVSETNSSTQLKDSGSNATTIILIENEREQSEIGVFKCDKCSYRAKSKKHLQAHRYVHKNEKPFKCEKCPFQAKFNCWFTRHHVVHMLLRPFQCDQCSFTGKSKDSIKKHQKYQHKVKSFKCDKCDYSAKHKTKLKQHQLSHTDVKTFKCDKCDYMSKYKTNLKNHKLIHLDPVNVKTYKCTKCDFVTKYGKSLKMHVMTHLDPTIQCDQCDYKTKFLVYLKKHNVNKHFNT